MAMSLKEYLDQVNQNRVAWLISTRLRWKLPIPFRPISTISVPTVNTPDLVVVGLFCENIPDWAGLVYPKTRIDVKSHYVTVDAPPGCQLFRDGRNMTVTRGVERINLRVVSPSWHGGCYSLSVGGDGSTTPAEVDSDPAARLFGKGRGESLSVQRSSDRWLEYRKSDSNPNCAYSAEWVIEEKMGIDLFSLNYPEEIFA